MQAMFRNPHHLAQPATRDRLRDFSAGFIGSVRVAIDSHITFTLLNGQF